MNGVNFPVERVLEGIEAAKDAGLAPIKINMVVKRGVNEDSILPMARYFNRPGVILRYIEYMDVGSSNGWRLDDVVQLIRGPKGTVVRLQILHDENDLISEAETIILTRDKIKHLRQGHATG